MEGYDVDYSFTLISGRGDLRIGSDRPFRAASVVKLFILISLYLEIQNGSIQEMDKLKENRDLIVEGGVLFCLSPLDLTIKDLATLMIVVSDNSASNLLLELLGFEKIAQTLRLLRTKGTQIERYFCDQEAIDHGRDNYTTGDDVVIALRCIAECNTIINDKFRGKMIEMLSAQQFRHKLPSYFDGNGGVAIFNKTGELPGIEHDVGLIQMNESFAYVAVLTSDWAENAVGQRKISLMGQVLHKFLTKS